MLDEYDQGSTVGFSITFKNTAGVAISPAGANLRVTYSVAGVETTTQYAMTMAAGVASYDWDTSSAGANADSGKVDWFATATGSTKSTKRGSFRLGRNRATPGV